MQTGKCTEEKKIGERWYKNKKHRYCLEGEKEKKGACINLISFSLHTPYLNLPLFRRCENISPPGTYSNTIYKLEKSCKRKIINKFH